MYPRAVVATNIILEHIERRRRRPPPAPRVYHHSRAADTSLYLLTEALVHARREERMSQRDVARRMRTTKSAISRLERGLLHRPTLTTLENYALVVRRRLCITIEAWP